MPLYTHRRRSPPTAGGSPREHAVVMPSGSPGSGGESAADSEHLQPARASQPETAVVVAAAPTDFLDDSEAVAGALGRVPLKPRPPPRRAARAQASV